MKINPEPPDGFKLDKNGLFCGRPMSHWNKEAIRLVVEGLLRASMCDTRSIVGAIASARLLEIAKSEDPEILQDTIEERDRCQNNLALIVGTILAP